MKMKTAIFTAVLYMAGIGLHAADNEFRVHARPAVQIPIGPALSDGTPWYAVGGGAAIGVEYDIPAVPYLVATLGFDADYLPIKNGGGESLTTIYAGLGIGGRFPLLPRVELLVAGGGGLAYGLHGDARGTLPYFSATTGIDFRVSPAMSVGIGGTFKQSFSGPLTLYQGVGVSIGMSYLLGSSGQSARLIVEPTLQTIYPLYYTHYDRNPLGSVRIRNTEDAAIQNVKISLNVPQFMDRPQLCADIEGIAGGSTIDVPLTALFTNTIFNVTEGLKVAADILIEYDYVGKSISATHPIALTVQNRNAMTWDDDRKAAAFMTTNHPMIKGYAKNLAATIRGDDMQAFSNEFRIALGIFTMLHDYGMQYIRDAVTPFAVLSEKPESIDQILFPIESLNFKAGDCDDLSVLYGTLLEAAGIETAFITTPGHIYIAFDLGISRRKAESLFPDVTDMIERDDHMWVPVEVTLVGDGFVKAWQIGAQEWRSASERAVAALIPAHEAWKVYSPAETSLQAALFLPNPRELIEPYRAELNRYIDRRLHELVARITTQIRETGGSARLYNRLGVTYAKYGRLNEAETGFRKALEMEAYAPAYINLGNVNYVREDFRVAQQMYEQALKLNPDSALALLGYIKTSYELEQFAAVNDSLPKLKELDSRAAESISYMSTASRADVGRASAAAEKEIWGWND